MLSYTRRNVNTISLIISLILFIIINNSSIYVYNCLQTNHFNKIQTHTEDIKKQETNETTIIEDPKQEKQLQVEVQTTGDNWEIIIPKINLTAPIKEGTSKEIMDDYVGHFSNTSILNGNVGLAAHNRGYKNNYFQDLKLLQKGDLIIYKTIDETKKYSVDVIKIIKDTDWTYLEDTQENRITLITCVENEPEYRRCIQGIEIKN